MSCVIVDAFIVHVITEFIGEYPLRHPLKVWRDPSDRISVLRIATLMCLFAPLGKAIYDSDASRLDARPITKPQWEFPRLCRGGSKSLTYPAVDTAAPSTKLRIASRQAHEEGFD
jgi:hypothetical protein